MQVDFKQIKGFNPQAPVQNRQGNIVSFTTYTPNLKQSLFHSQPEKYKAMIGAFRSGKTLCATYEGLQLSWAFPGNTGLICRKDYTTLRDSTMQTFFGVLPKDSPLIESWNETTHDLWLKPIPELGDKPSHIMFRGADEYLNFGSYELGWFWIDQAEQVKQDVYEMLESRLSRQDVRLCGMITPNPPNQYHWIYKIFKLNKKPNYFVIHTSTYDNKEHLPIGYIEEMEKKPENWKRMYLYGEYGFMAEGDPVYADFRSEVHKSKETLIPIRSLPIVRSWDFGYHFPAVGFFQYNPANDRLYKLAEVLGQDMIIDRFADSVIQFGMTRFQRTQFEDVCDPAGDQKNDKSERTSIEILESKGVTNIKRKPTFIRDGLNLIRRYLIVRDDGRPGYIIDPSCTLTEEAYLGGYYLKKESDIPDDQCHPYCDIADTDRYAFVNMVELLKSEYRRPARESEVQTNPVTGY